MLDVRGRVKLMGEDGAEVPRLGFRRDEGAVRVVDSGDRVDWKMDAFV